MELEGGEEFVMEETSGVSKGVSDNSRTSACFREHLHFHVTVVCDVFEGRRRFQFLHVVAVHLMRPICFVCCLQLLCTRLPRGKCVVLESC